MSLDLNKYFILFINNNDLDILFNTKSHIETVNKKLKYK